MKPVIYMKLIKYMLLFVFCAECVQAQLAVAVSPVRITGEKAVVELAMTNNLTEPVEFARAVCFLVDDQGKMVAQATKWVIGANGKPALRPKIGTTFNVVITSPQRFATTKLTARVLFSRLALEGGKLANRKTDVQIQGSN